MAIWCFEAKGQDKREVCLSIKRSVRAQPLTDQWQAPPRRTHAAFNILKAKREKSIFEKLRMSTAHVRCIEIFWKSLLYLTDSFPALRPEKGTSFRPNLRVWSMIRGTPSPWARGTTYSTFRTGCTVQRRETPVGLAGRGACERGEDTPRLSQGCKL